MERIKKLLDNTEKAIIGKRKVTELIVTALLSDGSVLIEDVPGIGKTQLASAIAKSCGGKFGRVQFTPDIMPNDITGFTMINSQTQESKFIKGAAFCNFLLADEINRASPKAQSALLEIMEEKQVSVDAKTYKLPQPFIVLATQNPVETYGTYHLPEAQMDRFIMKVSIGYPALEDEVQILQNNKNKISASSLDEVITLDDILSLREMANNVKCTKSLAEYIVKISEMSRMNELIKMGISPRGSIALYRAAKSYALVCGRNYVVPEDIKFLAPYVLAHRIILTPKGQSVYKTNECAVEKVIDAVQVPLS